ncbi:MAG TPA: hypothetical protein VJB65_00630, partial [Patescibacteria group bacterium]|nr:hypothetical protein [Patescibacteria group bacterium]
MPEKLQRKDQETQRVPVEGEQDTEKFLLDSSLTHQRLADTRQRLSTDAMNQGGKLIYESEEIIASGRATGAEIQQLESLNTQARNEQLTLLQRLDAAEKKVKDLQQQKGIQLQERIVAEKEYEQARVEAAGSTALKIHEARQRIATTEAESVRVEKSVIRSYADKLNPMNWFKSGEKKVESIVAQVEQEDKKNSEMQAAQEQYAGAQLELIAQKCEELLQYESKVLCETRFQALCKAEEDSKIIALLEQIKNGYHWLGDRKFINTALYKQHIEPLLKELEAKGGKIATAAKVAEIISGAMNGRLATNTALLGGGIGLGFALGPIMAGNYFLGKRLISATCTYFGTADGLRSARGMIHEEDIKAQIKGMTSEDKSKVTRYASHVKRKFQGVFNQEKRIEVTADDLKKLSDDQVIQYKNSLQVDCAFSGKDVTENKLFMDLTAEEMRRRAEYTQAKLQELLGQANADYNNQLKKTAENERILSLGSVALALFVGSGEMAKVVRGAAHLGWEYGGKA